MRILGTILIAALMITGYGEAQAQFGNRLKDKLINKLENKAEEKVDKAADRALKETVDDTEEAVKNSGSNDNKGQAQQPQQGGEFDSGMTPADYEELMDQLNNSNSKITFSEPDLSNVEPNPMTGYFTMEFEEEGKRGKTEITTIDYYIGKYKIAMVPRSAEMEGTTSRIIIDRSTGKMTVLTDDGSTKSGVAMTMPEITIESDEIDASVENLKINRTGKTKMIEGKKCELVYVESDEFESEAWITDDVDMTYGALMNIMNVNAKGSNKSADKGLGDLMGFFPIESTTKDKKSGDVTVMRIRNFNPGAVPAEPFSTAGFQVMDMGGGFGDMMKQYQNQGK